MDDSGVAQRPAWAAQKITASTPSGLVATQPLAASGGRSRGRRDDGTIVCMNCKTTSTPLWRRDPQTGAHLCNRCGLYLKTYNVMHPLTRTKRRAGSMAMATPRADTVAVHEMDDVEQIPRPANCHPPQLQQLPEGARHRRVTPKQQMCLGITPKCFNCAAEATPLWRRDPVDNIICNACGLYYKLHGKARPVAMRQAVVRRRNRVSAAAAGGCVSVPAAAGGCVVRPAAASPDGLDTLARAAGLGLVVSKPDRVVKQAGLGMLEALASVAAAEITGVGRSRAQECQPQAAS
ncbi:GATA type transcriptional activator of nitrogen-regulated proteins [Coemansia spiralis]|nr:GATA type transcriptional activator of nitrogen-regulated proteins [Coemansia spiralis]